MDRTADLFVEQDLAGTVGDPVVRSYAELAEAAGAVVGVEHLDQELLALLRRCIHDLPAIEPEADARNLAARIAGGQVKADLSLGRVLDGTREELAVRHVVLAVGRDEGAALDPEAQIG